MNTTINKVFKTTKTANAILSRAGSTMLKASVGTAVQIANLYKDAGLMAFRGSKDLLQKTVSLTVKNQKELLKTSGEAIRQVAQSIREEETELKTMTKAAAKKAGKTTKRRKKQNEIKIDDLLEE